MNVMTGGGGGGTASNCNHRSDVNDRSRCAACGMKPFPGWPSAVLTIAATIAPTITTAADIAAGLVEAMAQAAYEHSRPPGSSRPPWADTTPGWRSQARQDMMAGMEAAAKAGWQMVRREP